MGEISDKKPALAETTASPSTTLSAHTLCVSAHTLSFRGPYHPRLGPSKTTLSLQCHFILKNGLFYTKDSPQKDWILLYNPGWSQSCDSSVLTSRCWSYKHTHLALLWSCCICPEKPGQPQSEGFQGRGRYGREQTTLEGPITMAT